MSDQKSKHGAVTAHAQCHKTCLRGRTYNYDVTGAAVNNVQLDVLESIIC